jgi:hypothetical protein
MKLKMTLSTLIFVLSITLAFSQDNTQTNSELTQMGKQNSSNRQHFIGSSLFMLGNLFPDPPSFYQLDYGYRLTPKDAIIIEAITWKYSTPLGIPYGPSFDSPDESYAGYVREYGIGVVYHRFIWKNFYSSAHAIPFLQNYFNSENKKIQNGFQLFLTLRFGYHLEFLKNRLFLEPSVAFNYWPINTDVPEAFKKLESKWPNYFIFEPGLHFGIKF